MSVVAVVYAFNEEDVLPKTLRILNGFKKKGKIDMVVVVNDGSTDATERIAKEHGAIVINHRRNLGKRRCFISGAHKVRDLGADVMLSLDADITEFPERTLEKMIERIKGGRSMIVPKQKEEDSRLETSLESTPQRAISVKALEPLFRRNKKWMQYLTTNEENRWGLESALNRLLPVDFLPDYEVRTEKAFRRNIMDERFAFFRGQFSAHKLMGEIARKRENTAKALRKKRRKRKKVR